MLDNFLSSPGGLLVRQQRRFSRRFYFNIHGIEPRQKHTMPEREKDEVQRQLLEQMNNWRRSAFRGPIALRLSFSTTEKNPARSHHITKNLLDLFGKARPTPNMRRRSLLYADDKQVHVLAVSCQHDQKFPEISGVARPLRDLHEELGLIEHTSSELDDDDLWNIGLSLHNEIDKLEELLREEIALRASFGERRYEAMLCIARRNTQDCLLGRAGLRPTDLAKMQDAAGIGAHVPAMWEKLFAQSPLQITLSELPQTHGGSDILKQEVAEKVRAFKARFGWIIDPLVIPVALQAIIRPPPKERQQGLHDLDNVLRKYLIPPVVDILSPVLIGSRKTSNGTNTTRHGITRFEVWRLPPASEGSKGFISLAVVSDWPGHCDVLTRIDDEMDKVIDHWERSL